MVAVDGSAQSVRANGASIHYTVAGAGQPLLLVHGFGSCGRDTWAPYVGALREQTPASLSTIRARTLLVHGDRDPFFPVSIPVEMYRAIPNAALWIVPNTEHEFPADTPHFLSVVQKFLRPPTPSK